MLVFVPGKPLQPSLMFVGKAGVYPSEAKLGVRPESCTIKLSRAVIYGFS